MSKIFKNQGFFILTLDTGIDLTSATVTEIKYRKSNGERGEFTASVVDTTKLTYQFSNDDLDVAGLWQFQAYVEIGGLHAFGEIVTQDIKKPL